MSNSIFHCHFGQARKVAPVAWFFTVSTG